MNKYEEFLDLNFYNNKNIIELSKYDDFILYWFVNREVYNYIMNNKQPRAKISWIKTSRLIFIFEILLDIIKYILFKIVKIFHRSALKPKNILFLANTMTWRKISDPKTEKQFWNDVYFYSIIDRLIDENHIVATHNVSLKNSFVVNVKRMLHWNVDFKPLTYYFDFNVVKSTMSAYSHFKKVWKSIESQNIKNTVIPDKRIKFYFMRVFPKMVKKLMLAKNALIKEDISLLLLINEEGSTERSFLFQSKSLGIPSIAIQHGEISPESEKFTYLAKYKNNLILPDITCVYGNYYYNLLIEKSVYSPDSLIVTGSHRYDNLYYYMQNYDKNKIKEKYNIDKNKKIILWTTQSHGIKMDENYKNIETVYKIIKKYSDKMQLVIKQHPGESKLYSELYANRAIDYNINIVLPDPKSDTFELIYACDLMITRHSTTAVEALCMDRPIIILNLSGEEDLANYVVENVAIGAYNELEFENAILQIINGEYIDKKYRDKYIENYLYKFDGKSLDRLISVINQYL